VAIAKSDDTGDRALRFFADWRAARTSNLQERITRL
jgi:hypothetical protein